MLVAAPRKGSADARQLEEHLDELARLVDTAGAEVVGRLSQQLVAPNSATLIGKGKVQELKELCDAEQATLVVFDEELSPVQGANIEKALDLRVMDRAEVILDIFSTRARSHEAHLQVELAQLEYLLPRLTRMWTHLSRIRGGIGLRGPGETQLETDRRMIRQKIGRLKVKLRDVAKHRENIRSGRTPMMTIALVGYTNAGKSSLLNALTGSDVLVEDRLFSTLDATVRRVHLPSGREALLSDTVGFVRDLPHQLVESFRSTLEEAVDTDLLLHVVDASADQPERQIAAVRETLEAINAHQIPEKLVLNKVDVISAGALTRLTNLHPDAVVVSAATGTGLEDLMSFVDEALTPETEDLELLIPFDRGDVVAHLHEMAEILSETHEEAGTHLKARVPTRYVAGLAEFRV